MEEKCKTYQASEWLTHLWLICACRISLFSFIYYFMPSRYKGGTQETWKGWGWRV